MSNTFGVAAAVQALREGKNLSGNEKSLACSHWASTSPSSASSVCGQRDITHSAQGAKPMNIHLHKNATTTPRIQLEIQQSVLLQSQLTVQYGVGIQTIQRWRNRDGVEDRSHTPHLLQTTPPSVQKEWQLKQPG